MLILNGIIRNFHSRILNIHIAHRSGSSYVDSSTSLGFMILRYEDNFLYTWLIFGIAIIYVYKRSSYHDLVCFLSLVFSYSFLFL